MPLLPNQARSRFEVANSATFSLVWVTQAVRDIQDAANGDPGVTVLMAAGMDVGPQFPDRLIEHLRARNPAEVEPCLPRPESRPTGARELRREKEFHSGQEVAERNDRRIVDAFQVWEVQPEEMRRSRARAGPTEEVVVGPGVQRLIIGTVFGKEKTV